MKDQILVIGACGQMGTELTTALRVQYGRDNVIAADIQVHPPGITNYMWLDVLDYTQLEKTVRECRITQIYLLTAMPPASGEQNAEDAWRSNVRGLLSVLKIAATYPLDKVFWPSSIAVFGPGSPKHNCPQQTWIEPNTVYGISKRAGEYWCNYYFEKYGVDVRSLRLPGLVSHTAPPGRGTTDYAVDIFHQAIATQNYTCFLSEETCLPMMYMPDAVRAALELMNAPKKNIKIRTSYNLAGMSFAPCDLAFAIKKHIPAFSINYQPDHRQAIADCWPVSLNDLPSRQDWGWQQQYDIDTMVTDMLQNLRTEKAVCTKMLM